MKDTMLETVLPESVGVSSKAVLDYINKMEERGVNLHSFLMMRQGKICAEGYWEPYSEEKLQRMYSISKTFTSAAIGLLLDEGKIGLHDKIADYFPEYLPSNPHPYILDIEIEDMLKMAVAFTETNHTDKSEHWVKDFFNAAPSHPSGTMFRYDTSASHTLCALVEKLTGMKMLDYMYERFLRHLGFSKDAWCIEGPDGYSWGGSGVVATLRDLAKFASVFLNEGKFNGRQLISREYVKKATSRQLDLDVFYGTFWTDYGYQIWILKNGGFAFRGMGSQHAICFPKEDFLFCCTADNQGTPLCDFLIYEELINHFIPTLKEEKLEENEYCIKLKEKCKNLRLSVQKGNKTSVVQEKINGKVYELEDNPMGISSLSFSFMGDEGTMCYKTPRGDKELKFGFGKHVEYLFPETHYYYERIAKPSGKKYRAISSAAWTEEDKLVIRTHTIDEFLGNITMSFSFKDKEIGVLMLKNAEWFFEEYHGYAGGSIMN